MNYSLFKKYKKQITFTILIFILLFAGIVRINRLGVPLERDEGEYAYAGQLILQGIPPYQEIYNMKFPGIYAAYAIFMAIFGQTHQSIHFSFLLINMGCILAIFVLARKILSTPPAIISAAIFAILSTSRSVEGFQAHAEHLVILLTLIGIIFLLQGIQNWKRSWLLYSGLLLGAAVTVKQHGIAFVFLAICYLLYASMKSKHRWQIAVKYLSTLLGGVLAVFLLLFFIMFITGVFSKFLFWTFTYSSKYISIIPLSQAWNQFKFGFMPLFATAPLVYIISSLGLVLLFIKKISQNMRVFVLLFGLFSFLSICPGFYFRPHYFVLFIHFIAILSATFVHFMINFGQSYNKVTYSVISILLLVMIIGQPIYYQYDYFFKMNHLQISRATYWLNPFHESLEIAAFIRQNSTDTDRIAILGSEPQIFFYSHRRSISPYIYMYPLMEEHDFALEMQKEFVHDLESKASRYIIYVHVPTSWLVQLNSQRLIFNWLDNFVKKEGVALVGLVELYDDHSLFFWREKTKWPPSTEHWVAIFEKI